LELLKFESRKPLSFGEPGAAVKSPEKRFPLYVPVPLPRPKPVPAKADEPVPVLEPGKLEYVVIVPSGLLDPKRSVALRVAPRGPVPDVDHARLRGENIHPEHRQGCDAINRSEKRSGPRFALRHDRSLMSSG
jgi:hypothetical protein